MFLVQTSYDLEKTRLSRAVETNDPDFSALKERQRYILENLLPGREGPANAMHGEYNWWHGRHDTVGSSCAARPSSTRIRIQEHPLDWSGRLKSPL